MSIFLAAVVTLALPAGAGQLSNMDRAKLLERIGGLEADLVRITRELEELRGQLADKKPLPKQQKWLQALDDSYKGLMAEALDQESFVAADKAFERGEPAVALRLLRTGRHRAAVPLILKDMVRRQAQGKLAKDELKEHLLALALLTGEEAEEAFARIRFAGLFVEGWWLPRRDAFVTDIARMTPAQRAHVARRLREIAPTHESYKANGPSYEAHALLYSIFYGSERPERGGAQSWVPEELHPALGPVFLTQLGYRPEGAGGQDVAAVPYQLVHILAEMRKQSALPQLDKIAEDAAQSSAVRLVCLMALASAKEGVRVPAILSILAREKKLDRRLAALELLYYADDLEPAADYLIEILDDPNAEVRRSTLNALGRKPPPRVFARLKQLAEARHDEKVLETIAAIRTVAAQQFLADYLAMTLHDRPRTERLHDTLWAFQHATEQSWISAGRYTFEHYEKLALKALAWWKENKGK
jgi:hypothetical protein